MFRKAKAFFLLFLLFFTLFISYITFHSPLVPIELPPKIDLSLPTEPFQYRSGIKKDLHLGGQERRMHYLLESPASTLSFETHPFEIRETFEEMQLWTMQDDLQVLKSEDASFFYFQRILAANDVIFGSYPNDQKQMEIDGKAKTILLSFKTHPPQLSAAFFQANFNDKRAK